MKRVAIAGGSGGVAKEVIHTIVCRGNFQVVILSRNDAPSDGFNGVQWKKVDYDEQDSIVAALDGVDTLLSFIATGDTTAGVEVQKNMIQAAIRAGVRRFAPSEWATKSNSGVSHYANKDVIRKYLEDINSDKKQIEYCLFQPGFFTNYFATPHSTTQSWRGFKMFADFEHRRAIIMDAPNSLLTLTTLEDMCMVVALALEYPGEWPTVGGIQGTQKGVSGFLRLAEKVRGPFEVERLLPEDVAKGDLNASWYPLIEHRNIPEEYREDASKRILKEYLASIAGGGWSVSDEWNKLLPDFRFTSAEEYLNGVWNTAS